MKRLARGIAVAALHCLIVLSLAGKYAFDRDRLPRVWAKTQSYDPNLPIRGRYASLRVQVEDDSSGGGYYKSVRLQVRDGHLEDEVTRSEGVGVIRLPNGAWVLSEPVAFFLSEQAADPTRRAPGEELWVELSVPPKGGPRPLRLGVKKDGVLTPLPLR
jgi:hypothetical protein